MTRDAKLALPIAAAIVVAAMALAPGAFALAGATPLHTKGSTAAGAATGSRSVVLTLAPSNASGLKALVAHPNRPRLPPASSPPSTDRLRQPSPPRSPGPRRTA